MKKRVLATLIAGSIFFLAGCQNKVNRDFLDRLTDFQAYPTTEASIAVTDVGIDDSTGMGMLTPYIKSGLEAVTFDATIQSDATDADLMSLSLGFQVADQANPLLDGIIQDGILILNAEDYINLQLLTGQLTQNYSALNQLLLDYQRTFIAFDSEPEEEAEALSAKSLLDVRKRFLDLDSENFSETDTELTVTLAKEDLQTLIEPLMTSEELTDLVSESADIGLTVTLNKEEPLLSIIIDLNQIEFDLFNKLGMDMTMTFSNEEATITAPDPALVTSQEQLQQLLTPEHSDGFSATGYPDALFANVLTNVETYRKEWNRDEGSDYLASYRTLLTEEQHAELENVMDVPTLVSPHYPGGSTYPVTEERHSNFGLDRTRFEALIDSVTTYRDAQTKESAQKTLDEYYQILTESQYKQLEKALDIESLPE